MPWYLWLASGLAIGVALLVIGMVVGSFLYRRDGGE